MLERRSCGVSRLWLGSRSGCYGLNTIFTSSKTVLDDITWAVWRPLIYFFFLLSLKPLLSSIERNDFPLWNPSACTGIAGSSKLRKFQFSMASFRAQSPHLIYYPLHSYFYFFLNDCGGNWISQRKQSLQSFNPRTFFFFFLMRPQAPVIPPVPSAAERRGFIVAALLHLQGQPQSLPPWASAISSAFLNTVGLSNLLNRNEFSSLPFHFKTLGSFFFYIFLLLDTY